MRERREVYGLKPGERYKEVVLPELADPLQAQARARLRAHHGSRAAKRISRVSLSEAQRAFRYGRSGHVCVVSAGVTRYLPVAPFDVPDFADLARVAVGVGMMRG
jgi:hypothetical protein